MKIFIFSLFILIGITQATYPDICGTGKLTTIMSPFTNKPDYVCVYSGVPTPTPTPTPSPGGINYMLVEDGTFLLLEDGSSKLLLEQ